MSVCEEASSHILCSGSKIWPTGSWLLWRLDLYQRAQLLSEASVRRLWRSNHWLSLAWLDVCFAFIGALLTGSHAPHRPSQREGLYKRLMELSVDSPLAQSLNKGISSDLNCVVSQEQHTDASLRRQEPDGGSGEMDRGATYWFGSN
jgi:hypothetical protein